MRGVSTWAPYAVPQARCLRAPPRVYARARSPVVEVVARLTSCAGDATTSGASCGMPIFRRLIVVAYVESHGSSASRATGHRRPTPSSTRTQEEIVQGQVVPAQSPSIPGLRRVGPVRRRPRVGLTILIKDQLGNGFFLLALVRGRVAHLDLPWLPAAALEACARPCARVFEYHGAEHKTISCY